MPPATTPATNPIYDHTQYTIRRKLLNIFGLRFHIYDPNGRVVMYCKLKAFKLKEDIRLYTGEDMRQELLSIKARNIIDTWGTYDVFDSITGEKVGVLRRKGLASSFVRDEWHVLDDAENLITTIMEDSLWLGLIRRYVGLQILLPQSYHFGEAALPLATARQHFNPFVFRLTLDCSSDTDGLIDRRLLIAAALLLAAIEGRQG